MHALRNVGTNKSKNRHKRNYTSVAIQTVDDNEVMIKIASTIKGRDKIGCSLDKVLEKFPPIEPIKLACIQNAKHMLN
jgi:uncharacterized pyridoxamine 5'-phosphate oxidase family protein